MRTLGIEFGSWSLKAVEIETKFRRMDILDFHEIRLPLEMTDPQDHYKAAVTKLMDRLPHHPEKLVTSLPMSQTALRFFHIPVKQVKKVEQMYRFELEDNVPFKLDQSIVEHHITKTKEGCLVAAGIAPIVHIKTHLEWLQSVGVDPDWLTFDGMGLINLYLRAIDEQKKGKKGKTTENTNCYLLLDIGHLKTGLAIIDDNQLEHYRSLPWGGAHLTHAIAKGLGTSLEEAEKKKHDVLNLEVDPSQLTGELQTVADACHRAIQPFFSDIHHSLVAFRAHSKKEADEILLTGGSSATQGLDSLLASRFKRPASVFNPLARSASANDLKETDTLRFGESYGRATVFERKASLLFNFRKQEVAKTTSLTEVSNILKDPHVVRLLKYAGALAVILFIHVTFATHFAKQEADSSKKELRKVFSQTFRGVPKKLRVSLTKNPEALGGYISKRNKEFNQKLKMLSNKRSPMVKLIDSISQSFPKNVKVDVNVLNIDDRSLKIEGVLYEGDIQNVLANLKKLPSLSNVKLARTGQRFTFSGQIEGR